MNKIEEIREKIEASREILDTLPQNNDKNKEKYQEKLREFIQEYEEYEEIARSELKNRYQKAIIKEDTKTSEEIEKKIKELQQAVFLLNNFKSSYERMELDKEVYRLIKFYKENLEDVNEQILICIQKFQEVGINLTVKDFNYTPFVQNYMSSFLEARKEGDVNSEMMKKKFEEMYWKCPEIVIHIMLNIRYLYLIYENQIDRFYRKEKENFIKKTHLTLQEVGKAYQTFEVKYLEEKRVNKYYLQNLFLSGKENIKEYAPEKMKANYQKVLPKEILESKDKEQWEEINNNILKLLNTLKEYKNYLKFAFIFKDIQSHYQEKANYKNVYMATKKKIKIEEAKFKRHQKKCLRQKKMEKTAECFEMVMGLKALYKELSMNEVYQKIYTNFKESYTIIDSLYFAASFYYYSMECILHYHTEYTREEAEKFMEDLNSFIWCPYNTVINNITILEEKDIPMIIKDHYSLLKFEIQKEDLEENAIDGIITALEKIQIYLDIQKSGLSVEKIAQCCEMKKRIEKSK